MRWLRPIERPRAMSESMHLPVEHGQFCALEYRPQDWSLAPLAPAVILLVLNDRDGGLVFLAHPELRSIVRAEDLPYIQSLLNDLLERAKQRPRELFKQLSSLGVG